LAIQRGVTVAKLRVRHFQRREYVFCGEVAQRFAADAPAQLSRAGKNPYAESQSLPAAKLRALCRMINAKASASVVTLSIGMPANSQMSVIT